MHPTWQIRLIWNIQSVALSMLSAATCLSCWVKFVYLILWRFHCKLYITLNNLRKYYELITRTRNSVWLLFIYSFWSCEVWRLLALLRRKWQSMKISKKLPVWCLIPDCIKWWQTAWSTWQPIRLVCVLYLNKWYSQEFSVSALASIVATITITNTLKRNLL